MQKISHCLRAMIGAACISGLLLAESTVAVRAADEIRIVVQNVEPLAIQETPDRIERGILVDLFLAAQDRSAIPVTIVSKPVKRGLTEYKTGREDAVVFLTRSGVEEYSHQSIPLVPVNRIYVALAHAPFDSMMDAKKLTTAIMLGTSIEVIPAEFRPAEQNIIWVPSVEQMVNMVERNRFDAIVGSDVIIYYHLRKMNKGPDYVHEPVPLQKAAIALHVGPKTASSTQWQTYLAALRAELGSPNYHEILRRYLGTFADVLG